MSQQSSKTLASLLAAEDQRRREFARRANTRHSRFGTTIAVTTKPAKVKPAQPENGGGRSRASHHVLTFYTGKRR